MTSGSAAGKRAGSLRGSARFTNAKEKSVRADTSGLSLMFGRHREWRGARSGEAGRRGIARLWGTRAGGVGRVLTKPGGMHRRSNVSTTSETVHWGCSGPSGRDPVTALSSGRPRQCRRPNPQGGQPASRSDGSASFGGSARLRLRHTPSVPRSQRPTWYPARSRQNPSPPRPAPPRAW